MHRRNPWRRVGEHDPVFVLVLVGAVRRPPCRPVSTACHDSRAGGWVSLGSDRAAASEAGLSGAGCGSSLVLVAVALGGFVDGRTDGRPFPLARMDGHWLLRDRTSYFVCMSGVHWAACLFCSTKRRFAQARVRVRLRDRVLGLLPLCGQGRLAESPANFQLSFMPFSSFPPSRPSQLHLLPFPCGFFLFSSTSKIHRPCTP